MSGRDRVRELRGRAEPALSVGVLSGDLLRLGEELDLLAAAGVDFAHLDVMDGRFCPPTTVGPPLTKALAAGPLPVDAHLMVADPLVAVEAHVAAGAELIAFHPEATIHPHRVLARIEELDPGVARGVALNPGTPLASIEPLLDRLELILVLAIDPGWSGQSFLPSTADRLREARELIGEREIALAVDGGVTAGNVGEVAALGVDLIVTGSAVYAGDPRANLEAMRAAIAAA